MLWTPNSDARPDCTLRKRREIMRQKGRHWNRAWRERGGCWEISVCYLWLVLPSRFPLQSAVAQWNRVQANTLKLCCASDLPYASQQPTIVGLGVAHSRCNLWPPALPLPTLAFTQRDWCVGECSRVSQCVAGLRAASSFYIKSINASTFPTQEQHLTVSSSSGRDLWGQDKSSLDEYDNDSPSLLCIAALHKCMYWGCMLICVCVCVLVFLQAVKLSHWALLRDSIYYTFSITALIVVRGHRPMCKHSVHMMEWGDCGVTQMCHSFGIETKSLLSASAEMSTPKHMCAVQNLELRKIWIRFCDTWCHLKHNSRPGWWWTTMLP